MAASIEAITISVLIENGYDKDCFDRNDRYSFKDIGYEKIKAIKSFLNYNKLNAIWNFLKHNNKSAYKDILKVCPEILTKDQDPINNNKLEYKPGDLAAYYIQLSEFNIDKI